MLECGVLVKVSDLTHLGLREVTVLCIGLNLLLFKWSVFFYLVELLLSNVTI